jgi:hypothetical protein
MGDIDWASFLLAEDAEALWNGLFKLVSRHPCVRPLRFATDEAAVASEFEINADLTQELFLELLQKQRFQYYADQQYCSSDIENELTRIELPNLVGARLRKRYPESFRMARRISSILKTSPNFRMLGALAGGCGKKADHSPDLLDLAADEPDDVDADELSADPGERRKRQRMVNQVFALRKWGKSKLTRDPGQFGELVKSVPMRARDTRVVGRAGTSQLILSNPALEELIIEIFLAIDSPADVKTMRQLTLSRIPLQDYSIATLDRDFAHLNGEPAPRKSAYRLAADSRLTPEDELIGEEHRQSIASLALDFLDSLKRAVNDNPRRYCRLMRTLWHCYYDPEEPSQLETARMLGVSDSLVSDNRKLIERELKKMRLSLEDGAVFADSLRRLVMERTTPGAGLVLPGRSAEEAIH